MTHADVPGHQAHVLLVDDDERIRSLLQKFLMRNGYLTTAARDSDHARRLLAGLDFDIAILDVMMPGDNGFILCAEIRETRDMPVLLLTAKGETSDRITGLEAGADDYLPKPFEPKELLLRLKAILRRAPQAAHAVPKMLHLGPIRYDLERGELWQDGALVRLTATETILMRIFAETPHEAVSRGTLVERLGRDEGGTNERAVDVQITRLRRKLERDPKQPRYLQTVRGEGYMLAPD
ncbi:response regulator [Jannaschia seohaensis]|uniref:Two-component system phosphate regulon response regulator OmpR n=1 Tax=Jannaschia seohaensis TaxID=475081 RepID=A0A2Y9AXC7_9RHOB|nr:response regulator transcription factor [Jannaschia seohaensis]PWJ16509.1 two-component system phosphate regulon response regulator OmpR [Jannaschia seohaensis]SSA48746.1 two-component system, OmpR family, phosphate regulon response regulator OmpR [Jannaschia seohaensis]